MDPESTRNVNDRDPAVSSQSKQSVRTLSIGNRLGLGGDSESRGLQSGPTGTHWQAQAGNRVSTARALKSLSESLSGTRQRFDTAAGPGRAGAVSRRPSGRVTSESVRVQSFGHGLRRTRSSRLGGPARGPTRYPARIPDRGPDRRPARVPARGSAETRPDSKARPKDRPRPGLNLPRSPIRDPAQFPARGPNRGPNRGPRHGPRAEARPYSARPGLMPDPA